MNHVVCHFSTFMSLFLSMFLDIVTIQQEEISQTRFLPANPYYHRTPHLSRFRRELQFNSADDVGRNESGHHATKNNQRLADAGQERNIIRDNQLPVTQIVDQVTGLDNQGRPADSIQEGLVDLNVGAGDGGERNGSVVLDVPANVC